MIERIGSSAILLLVLGSSASQKLSREEERWLERDVRALITEREAGIYRKLPTSEDRTRFQEIFWARRDPDPRTAENEFREEFENRLQVADSLFRARVGTGSSTDMGLVFLVLGFPESVGTGRGVVAIDPSREGGIPESLEGSGTEEAPPGRAVSGEDSSVSPQRIQTWVYPPNEALGIPDGLEVRFRAQPGYGYRLVRTDELDRWLEMRRSGLVTRPEIDYAIDEDGYLLPLSGDVASRSAGTRLDEMMASGVTSDEVPFDVTPGFFRSNEDTVYVPLLFELQNGGPAAVTFFGAVSKDEREVERFESRVSLSEARASFELPLQLAPGDYVVHLGVLDEESGLSGSRITSLSVAGFDPEALSTSSIVLHGGVKRTEEPGGVAGRAFQFGALQLAPRSRRPFQPTEDLGIFYFVYGGASDPETGKPRITARYVFYRAQQEAAQTEPRLLAAGEGQAVASDAIPLATFEPGEYRLVVLVTDQVAGKSLERRASFRLVP